MSQFVSASRELELGRVGEAIDVLMEAYHARRCVFAVGNGGSASTAAHFAADLGKFATGQQPGFRAFDCVSNVSANTAWTNDEGWDNTWTGILAPWLEAGDVLVAFSVNGGRGFSSNLVKALEFARQRQAKTIGISGNGGGKFNDLCDVSIVVPTPDKALITPLTEAIHVVIHHLICAEIRHRLNGNEAS